MIKKKETTVSEAGRKGGKARASNQTKKERIKQAKKAALARWGKKGKQK